MNKRDLGTQLLSEIERFLERMGGNLTEVRRYDDVFNRVHGACDRVYAFRRLLPVACSVILVRG